MRFVCSRRWHVRFAAEPENRHQALFGTSRAVSTYRKSGNNLTDNIQNLNYFFTLQFLFNLFKEKIWLKYFDKYQNEGPDIAANERLERKPRMKTPEVVLGVLRHLALPSENVKIWKHSRWAEQQKFYSHWEFINLKSISSFRIFSGMSKW
jgi:hypothetical protein